MIKKINFFKKTRNSILNAISTITGKKFLDFESIDEFEEKLLLSDIGFDLTEKIVQKIQGKIDSEVDIQDYIKQIFKEYLSDLKFSHSDSPNLIMISGINGTGKTTTCAKLAKYYKSKGKKVFIIAADTFRAAAIEQIQFWSQKNNIHCFSKSKSNDPSSVIYDGLKTELCSNSDVTIIDTAGRLHTSSNLMSELSKMERVISKFHDNYDSWISLDATTGQNSLQQIDIFKQNLKINGIVLNKMDGSSKGGVAIPIMKNYKIPIKFIGIGEQDDDFIKFCLDDYLDGLFYEKN